MKYSRLLPVVVFTFVYSSLFAATLDERLQEKSKESSLDSWLPVLVKLNEQVDLDRLETSLNGLTRAKRKEVVWKTVESFANKSQVRIRRLLQDMTNAGLARNAQPVHILNSLVVDVRNSSLSRLVNHPDIDVIMYGGTPAEVDMAGRIEVDVSSVDQISWGVTRIRAPQVWAMGYNGSGVVVAVIDVGVNYNHTDLVNRMWDGGTQYPHHGYDYDGGDNDPLDASGGHGTSCSGIVAGDGTSGNQTGVAPGARIMALKVNGESQCLQAHNFALQNGADVTTMSLGYGASTTAMRTSWRQSFATLSLAGIHNSKSCGNNRGYGYSPPTCITVPGDVPSPWRHPSEVEQGGRGGLIAVGASTNTDVYASFSSFGPVSWQGVPTFADYPYGTGHVGLIKPDIILPGNNILTITGTSNSYTSTFSGTSAASPHNAGLLALLLSKNPELLPVQADSIMQSTAVDLGPVGKDNDYGAGLVMADTAIRAVPMPVLPTVGTIDVGTYDLSNFESLPNVTVRIRVNGVDSLSGLSDSTGHVSFTLPAGVYSVISSRAGYNMLREDGIRIDAQQTTHVAQYLEPVNSVSATIPAGWHLFSVSPNPFNSTTWFRISLPRNEQAILELFDANGRLVKTVVNQRLGAGEHRIALEAAMLPTGVYFARLRAGSLCRLEKVVLMR